MIYLIYIYKHTGITLIINGFYYCNGFIIFIGVVNLIIWYIEYDHYSLYNGILIGFYKRIYLYMEYIYIYNGIIMGSLRELVI